MSKWVLVLPIESWGVFCEIMIDLELFRKILSKDEGYIVNGDFIPLELFDLMCSSPVDKVKSLFVKQPRYTHPPAIYFIEVRCSACHKVEILKTTRTGIFDIISSFKITKSKYKHIPYRCQDCRAKEEINRRERQEQAYKEFNERKKRKTEEYISSYLNPNRSWREDVPNWRRFKFIKDTIVDWERVKTHIQNMDYYEFLKTPYWKAISEKVKQKADYRCQICNSRGTLSTHHRSYSKHGDEAHNLEDLICICQECHQKHHFD